MQVTINISPEERAQYEALAAAEGLRVEDWLKKLADRQIHVPAGPGIAGADLLETCKRVRGLTDDLDFDRNLSSARPLDL